jgi:hypothetical protein
MLQSFMNEARSTLLKSHPDLRSSSPIVLNLLRDRFFSTGTELGNADENDSLPTPSSQSAYTPAPAHSIIAQLQQVLAPLTASQAVLDTNARSLKALRDHFRLLAESRGHPPASVSHVEFLVAAGAEGSGQLRVVRAQLKTTGGDCRKLVAKNLRELFGQLGLEDANAAAGFTGLYGFGGARGAGPGQADDQQQAQQAKAPPDEAYLARVREQAAAGGMQFSSLCASAPLQADRNASRQKWVLTSTGLKFFFHCVL